MPVFEYKCIKCKHSEERWWGSISKVKEKLKCSKCGSNMDKQFPSKGVFILKNKASDSSNWGDKGYTTKT